MSTQLAGLIGKGKTTVAGIDTAVQIWGLWHFLISGMGTTVSVQIIGQDCGDFTVGADGSVTVPLASAGGVVSIANLIAANGLYDVEQNCPISILNGSGALNINVPVVIGRSYVSQGQRLRPAAATDIRSQTGDALGKTRRTHMFSALVSDAVIVRFGSNLTPAPYGDMVQQVFTTSPTDLTPLAAGASFSGVFWDTLTDDYTFDSMLCWQVDRPWPLVVCSVGSFLDAQDR